MEKVVKKARVIIFLLNIVSVISIVSIFVCFYLLINPSNYCEVLLFLICPFICLLVYFLSRMAVNKLPISGKDCETIRTDKNFEENKIFLKRYMTSESEITYLNLLKAMKYKNNKDYREKVKYMDDFMEKLKKQGE